MAEKSVGKRHLGSFLPGDLEMLRDPTQSIVGARVAIRDSFRALLKHGTYDEYSLFAPRRVMAQNRDSLGALRAKGLSLVELSSLMEQVPALTAWHATELAFTSALHVRARSPRVYPITAVHHTFSPQTQIQTAFLPLLLGDVRACDAVICSSRAARDAIRGVLAHVEEEFARSYGARLQFPGRTPVIPIGVDTELYRPRDKREMRAQLRLPQNVFMILWLGRLSMESKGDLLPFFHVLRDLAADFPDRKLLMVLAGQPAYEYNRLLQSYANALGVADMILFETELPIDQGALLCAAADVFVSPVDNLQEAFGIAPVEAMACGVPQVVSDWDGYKDTVEHGVTGFRVPTYWTDADDDVMALASVIGERAEHVRVAQSVAINLAAYRKYLGELIRNEALRQTFAEASRQRAVSLFDWKPVVAQYEALWEELAAAAAGEPAPVARDRYTFMPYGRAFSGYPTRMLGGDAMFQASSQLGELVPRLEAGLYQSAFFAPDRGLLVTITGALAGAPLSFAALSAAVERQHPGRPSPVVRRHIMWLLKYGYIELSTPA